MPRSVMTRLGLKTIASLLFLCMMVAGFARWPEAPNKNRRDVAALAKMKWAMGKHQSAIQVQLYLTDDIPDSGEKPVEIQGYINLAQKSSVPVSYKWELPAGVSLVSGSLEGNIDDLAFGESSVISIQVTGFSKEVSQQVVLSVTAHTEEQDFGNSALITSRPEDSMEYIAPELRDYAENTRPKEFARGRRMIR